MSFVFRVFRGNGGSDMRNDMRNTPLRIGIGGPVGSGKTALVDALCKSMRDLYRLAVITNDIFTR